jgi:hypothetical protein
VGANVGGYPKIRMRPRTQEIVQCARSSRAMTQEETKNLLKDSFSLKSCEGFRSLRVRNFEVSQVQDSILSLVRDFAASQVQDSRSLLVRDSETSRVQDSKLSRRSRLCSLAGSTFQIIAYSLLLKTYFTNFINFDVTRGTGFPEFPNSRLQI